MTLHNFVEHYQHCEGTFCLIFKIKEVSILKIVSEQGYSETLVATAAAAATTTTTTAAALHGVTSDKTVFFKYYKSLY